MDDNAYVLTTIAKYLGLLNDNISLVAILNKKYTRFTLYYFKNIDNINLKYTNTQSLHSLIFSLLKSFKKNKLNYILASNYAAWIASYIFNIISDFKYSIILHGTDIRTLSQRPLYKKLPLLLSLKYAHKLFATTPDLLLYSKYVQRNFVYLPQPIDPDLFKPYGEYVELYGDPVVFVPTRLSEEKGATLILWILKFITINYPKAMVYLVKWRNNSYINFLQKFSNVKVISYIPRNVLPAWYRSVDIVIGQFKIGSPGMIELESMACGTPVVFYDKYLGYGVKSLNIREITEFIRNIIEDKEFRRIKINKGLNIINKYHLAPTVANTLLKEILS